MPLAGPSLGLKSVSVEIGESGERNQWNAGGSEGFRPTLLAIDDADAGDDNATHLLQALDRLQS
jgi:hypothetical protein